MHKITELYHRSPKPIKVIQFGEGNFLRGFVDYMIDIANETGDFQGDVAVIKPTNRGNLELFHKQDNLYTVSLRGKLDGQPYIENRVITCLQKVVNPYTEYSEFQKLARLDSVEFIISNTTEAGIVFDPSDKLDSTPAASFPGKLTQFLYERFQAFSGDAEKGVIILPTELLEENGTQLKECILKLIALWGLSDDFKKWVCESCVFCNTLVDRIISGRPKTNLEKAYEELGYEDELLDNGEPFASWVIESKMDISQKFPLARAMQHKKGMDVVFTENQKPYRERKVRILNGAHTSTVLAGYLAGKDIVRECMEDPDISGLMKDIIFEEVIPTVNLPKEEAVSFANSVFERFDNPFVNHSILDISLNSVSKWKARILPTFRDNYEKGILARRLTFSFAALALFYSSDRWDGDTLVGMRNGAEYQIRDDKAVLTFFAENCKKPTREFVGALAARTDFWGEDLNRYDGFVDLVCADMESVKKDGMAAVIHRLVKES